MGDYANILIGGTPERVKRRASMQLSYNWLRELLPELNASASDVGERLTDIGLELEGVQHIRSGLESVVLARVVEVKPHPERDRLQLVTVNRGNTLQDSSAREPAEKPASTEQMVVCGASNVPAPGGLVVLAPLGTYLPAVDLKLEPRKLGGIMSEGMLCSEAELGLSGESDGILTFAEGTFEPGTPLVSAVTQAADTIFEIGVTPNRPDALGHVGVARDLAAAYGLDFTGTAASTTENSRDAMTEYSVENAAKNDCLRYSAQLLAGIKVKPSPQKLRWRLHALGIRPINNVVDIVNLVMLEFGSPMHAFDFDRIKGAQVVIRQAASSECLTTLDGIERKLESEDIVICDSEGPIALAGVMGGANSEIRDQTTQVLLEGAYFSPSKIRKTSKRLGMHTDASHRFERGVDFAVQGAVLARATELLAKFAGGKPVGKVVRANGASPTAHHVPLTSKRLNGLLGYDVDFDEAKRILRRLGFVLQEETDEQLLAEVPSWRPDVTLEADLIEEVGRIRGLDAIPTTLPFMLPQPPAIAGTLQRTVRHAARALGLSEAVTYSFVDPKDLEKLGAPKARIALRNPLSEERSVMTTSLLPGLLEALKRARRRGEEDVRLFTTSSKFLTPHNVLPEGPRQEARPRAQPDLKSLPEERLSFAAILAGARPAHLERASELDIFDAKGLVESLLTSTTGHPVTVRLLGKEERTTVSHLHPRGASSIEINGSQVGCLGPLHPNVVDTMDLGGTAFAIEVDLEQIQSFARKPARYQPIPKLPAVSRDIAVEAHLDLSVGDIQSTIEASASKLCESVRLFDEFTGDHLPPDTRSLAFRLVYRDPRATSDPENAKTLTDKQVDKQHSAVVKAMAKLGVTVRA